MRFISALMNSKGSPQRGVHLRVPKNSSDSGESSERKKRPKTLYERFRKEADEHPLRYVAGVAFVPLYALLDEISTPKEKREYGESRLQKIVGAGLIELVKAGFYTGAYLGVRYFLNPSSDGS